MLALVRQRLDEQKIVYEYLDGKTKDRAARAPSLTPRERDLVDLVRQGLRNRDIAAKLGVTEGTVKVYLHAIFDKLGVDNRTELAMRAAELLGA